ncbi:MAG: hypothetical protein QG657_5769, partial [Acidobacteriota bacterium]|nr:hypothetical protein [Acidobacteriota bacterium]
EFNNTAANYPQDKTIHQLFEEQVQKTPDNVGLVGQIAITYRQLNEQANHLAGLLIKKGIAAEDIVGLKIDRSVEMIACILAILKAGGAYMPIDPEYPRERIEYMLKDSSARILIKKSEAQSTKSETNPNETNSNDQNKNQYFGAAFVLDFEHLNFDTVSNFVLRASNLISSNLAYIIYTSGTTGKPKGVMIEHRNVVRLLFNDKFMFDFNHHDTWTLFHSYCFDFSVWEMYGALLYGGKLVIIPKMATRDMGTYLEILRKNRVTILNQTPSAFYNLVSMELENPQQELNIRCVIFGGETLTPSRLKGWQKKYPGTKLINMYGITETTVHVTFKEISSEEIGSDDSNIGRPIPTLTTYIIDKHLRLQPVGVPGELVVGGDGVGRGYLNRQELTDEKFGLDLLDYRDVQDKCGVLRANFHHSSFSIHHSRFYRSGDLAKLTENGDLVYLGRIDRQVKIRGFRIETGEIEHQLVSHKDIKAAVVMVKEDKNGDKYLCAYIVPGLSTGISLSGPDLSDYLASKLPAYMIPSFFIQLDNLPLTASGKIDGKALPGPDFKTTTGESYVAPQDQTEIKLAALWSELLAIEKDKISINDGFFTLGGHSLKANILASKIHKAFHVKLSMTDIFMQPKLKDLAELIKKADKATYYSIQPTEEKEYYPLSSAQKRLYVLQQMDPRRVTYNVPAFAIMKGLSDKTVVENTFKQLIKRHESLRTSFFTLAEEVAQKIHKEVTFEIEYNDFSRDRDENNIQVDARADKIVKNFTRPFDLSQAPLLRVGLIKTAKERYILMVDQHHLISDGISQQVLLKEFLMLCQGTALPGLNLQYRDYSQWQNDLVLSGRMKKQEEYWLDIFKGKLPVLKIPTDYPRPISPIYKGNIVDFDIDSADAAKLRDFSSRENATLFILMLTLCSVFLFKLSGQEDIIIGTTAAGRHHADLENIIGVFINTLALRIYPSASKTFSDFFKEVKRQTLEAFDNQDYQFEDLVGQVLKERDSNRNPLFDVMFGFGAQENRPALEQAPAKPGSEIILEPYNSEYNESKFDLLIGGIDIGERFLFSIQYSTQLFKKETIQRFSQYFKEIISAVVGDESMTLKDIPLSSDLASANARLFKDDGSEFGF